MSDYDQHDDFVETEEVDLVRPFLVTPGRTKASVDGLQYETLVHATDKSGDDLRFEPAKIVELSGDAVALAEISAHLGIPIGTVKVVISDLIESGHLALHQTIDTHDDWDLVKRLIEGVRRL